MVAFWESDAEDVFSFFLSKAHKPGTMILGDFLIFLCQGVESATQNWLYMFLNMFNLE